MTALSGDLATSGALGSTASGLVLASVSFVGILQVVLALGLLIFVHEFGHFIMAKLMGVRVEAFSFGFGPYLLSFKRGETTYAVSAVPFGGYVKMSGQSDFVPVRQEGPPKPWEYTAKKKHQRAAIVLAGVVMNMIFAFGLLVLAFWVGDAVVPPEVGRVVPGTPAAEAGLQEGDLILSVAGRRCWSFRDVFTAVATREAGEPVEIVVQREGFPEPLVLTGVPVRHEEFGISMLKINPPSDPLRLGFAKGTGLGVVRLLEGKPAEAAGLKPGDVILGVDGQPVDTIGTFKKLISGKEEVEVKLRRGGEEVLLRASPVEEEVSRGRREYILGFRPNDLVVGDVVPGSPAEGAGVKKWDLIVSLGRKPGDDRVSIEWLRGGERHGPAVLTLMEDGPVFESDHIQKVRLARSGFFGGLGRAAVECCRDFTDTYRILWRLITRKMSLKALSGPVSIVAYTYQSTKPGLGHYLWFVAFISVNLAVINLVPMLPLDGGLLVFLLYETIRGRPVSRRIREAFQMVGLVLILALFIFVTHQDILRFVRP